MPKVTFGYDIRKDAWSWVIIAKSKDVFGTSQKDNVAHIPRGLLSQIQKNEFSQAVIITEKHLKNDTNRGNKEKLIKKKISTLEQAWRPIEEKYFNALSKITGEPISAKKFGCFITTGSMCPYEEKENWFMVSFGYSIPSSITTICHEIMHFQFLHYYYSYLKSKSLDRKQVEALKESLTFLLNEPEFNNVISSKDIGYSEHQDLRKKLKDIWSKTNNFHELINKAVPIMKARNSET